MCDIVTQDGCTALFLATNKGRLAVVRVLIEKGADVNICNMVSFNDLSSCPVIKEFYLTGWYQSTAFSQRGWQDNYSKRAKIHQVFNEVYKTTH